MFKTGDKVRIKKGTRFYNTNPSKTNPNPCFCTGVITKRPNENNIQVLWENDRQNSYIYEDLELVSNADEDIDKLLNNIPDPRKILTEEQKIDRKEIVNFMNDEKDDIKRELAEILLRYDTAFQRALEVIEIYEGLYKKDHKESDSVKTSKEVSNEDPKAFRYNTMAQKQEELIKYMIAQKYSNSK